MAAKDSIRAAPRGDIPAVSKPLLPSEEWPVLPVGRSWAKRVFDIGFSVLVLALTMPLMAVIAALVRLDSRGPAVFTQERVGRGGRRFRCYKFRTMRSRSCDGVHREYVTNLIKADVAYEGDDEERIYKVTDDPRVTGVGRCLRKTGLDELPQFWNVLRGDMSVVGPRPPLPYEMELYSDRHLERLLCRPGITGLWQVSGRSRVGFEQMVELDLQYLCEWSFGLDLKIIARTIPEVLGLGRNGF